MHRRPVPVAVLCSVALVATACTTSHHVVRSPSRTPSTTTSPSTPLPSSSPTNLSVAERNRPGSRWRIVHVHGRGIAGYADATSISPGQPVVLRVSTRARSFVVRAFRMGWYRGAEGRQVWRSAAVPGRRQPGPRIVGSTHTAVAKWTPSLTVGTTGWLPGDYLFRLDAADGSRSFVPLTVRAPSTRGRLVILSPVTTWQAYNRWGCCNLYVGADGRFATRSRAVSFDRPYLQENGAGEFIERELPVLAQAERLGLPLAYLTDVDLHADPSALAGATAVISMGHDEYWSRQMRAVLTRARDAGTNIAFFGANAVYRRIRFASSALGRNRVEVNYKIASEDPVSRTHPADTTADWPAPPHARPESSLTGAMYDCFPVRGAGLVTDPTAWVFAGTGVHRGTRLPHLIGPETDKVQTNFPTPRPLQVVMHSPVWCGRGYHSHSDATYYTTKAGAGVFDAGSIAWVCAVAAGCGVSAKTARVVRQVTDNILVAFAHAPAGRAHPAVDNLRALHLAH